MTKRLLYIYIYIWFKDSVNYVGNFTSRAKYKLRVEMFIVTKDWPISKTATSKRSRNWWNHTTFSTTTSFITELLPDTTNRKVMCFCQLQCFWGADGAGSQLWTIDRWRFAQKDLFSFELDPFRPDEEWLPEHVCTSDRQSVKGSKSEGNNIAITGIV